MARSKSFPDSVDPGMPVLSVCPSGWAQRKFGDVLRAIERPIALDDEMTYTLVNAKRSRGGIVLRDRKPGKEVKVPTQFIVREGDFVISRRQIIHGACGIVPRDLDGAIVSNEYLVLNSTDELSTKYLSYFSHTPYFQRTCFHSSVGVDVEKMVFKEDHWFQFPFPLPPLPEQKKIAAILSSVDEVIAKTEAVIAQLQIVKKAMMEQLLTKGMPGRHTRFKQTEIGEIPEEWEVTQLGMVTTRITKGESPNWQGFAYQDQGTVFVTSENVRDGFLLLDPLKFVPTEFANKIRRSRLLSGDVLVNLVGASIGRACIWSGEFREANVNQAVAVISPEKSLIQSRWILEMLYTLHGQRYFGLSKVDSARPNVSLTNLRDFPLPLPSLSEQAEIVAVGSSIVESTRQEELSLKCLLALKSALSSALLSGDIRVIPEVAG